MKIKTLSAYSLIYNITFFIVGLLSIISVSNKLYIIKTSTFHEVLYLLIAFLYVFSFIIYFPKLIISTTTVKLVCIYAVFFGLNSSFNYGGYTNIGNAVLSSCCWCAVFSLSYFYYAKNKFSEIIEIATIMALCILISLFFAPATIFASVIGGGEAGVLYSTPYYGLNFLPFVLMMKNKAIRILLNIGIISCIIISGKRGGFIAYGLAILVYYGGLHLYSRKISYKSFLKALKKFLYFSGICAIIVVLSNFLVEPGKLSVIERLELFFIEGNTSGRLELYNGVFLALSQNSIFEWFLGHGFRNTVLTIGNVAHNDFLEVLYDYGIVGLSILFFLLVSLIRDYFEFKKMKLECAPAFLSSLIIALTLMSVSEALVTPSYFIITAMFWGRCYREYDNRRRSVNCTINQ